MAELKGDDFLGNVKGKKKEITEKPRKRIDLNLGEKKGAKNFYRQEMYTVREREMRMGLSLI